jgi:hypothetical protein
MPCAPFAIKAADGTMITGIICGRGVKRRQKCGHCDHVGTQLCDFPVDRVTSSRTFPHGALKVRGTCDAPLCRCCATAIGTDRDLCPPHAAVWKKEP